ncbi:metal-dependent hydrolase [Deinococcus roseus]|uniref:UPF0173 metal-dependent hydrolase n=1 Tax=Deinococcus roseus TaxID=392414 RepID=A0ABQ2DAJ9_9DEIO|nr:metal-dependent hydrolase [Deinococcus roseus]GGJ51270.1 UPF0173 metal-dependent hydrolase [Deinococcus roseus]
MPAKLTFMGHASFKLVTDQGKTILIDPWLKDNPACPEPFKTFAGADLILITHGHGDHMDLEVIYQAARMGTRFVVPNPIRWFLIEQGIQPGLFEGMNKGGTIELMDVKITMTQAFHHAQINTENGAEWLHEGVGYVLNLGDSRIYVAGDTCIFGDMRLIAEIYQPTLALLPIGDRFTMGPLEASHAIRLLQVSQVVPFHYGTMPTLTGTPEQLSELTRGIEGLQILALQPGESLTL